MPFEVVAANASYFDGNTCHRASNVLKNGPKLSILTKQAFSNSIYPILMEN